MNSTLEAEPASEFLAWSKAFHSKNDRSCLSSPSEVGQTELVKIDWFDSDLEEDKQR